jgi:hypothetical protein
LYARQQQLARQRVAYWEKHASKLQGLLGSSS